MAFLLPLSTYHRRPKRLRLLRGFFNSNNLKGALRLLAVPQQHQRPAFASRQSTSRACKPRSTAGQLLCCCCLRRRLGLGLGRRRSRCGSGVGSARLSSHASTHRTLPLVIGGAAKKCTETSKWTRPLCSGRRPLRGREVHLLDDEVIYIRIV